MIEHSDEYYKSESEDFLKELESGKWNHAIAAHLGIRDHFIIRNGKKIRYPSTCDGDCIDEHRLFNGRDCPRRVKCMIENGDTKALSKGVTKEFEKSQDKAFKLFADGFGFLGNQR